MNFANEIIQRLLDLIPSASAIVLTVLIILGLRYILDRRFPKSSDGRFRMHLLILILSLIGLVVVIITLPVSESTTGQLLSLLGLLLSAAIALSATTFIGNIMAGLMLRAIRNFRPGDFVRIGDYFGKVSERGLFHVEIQTEDRDLTTLPNLYMVTNPVKVIRSSGTLLTAEVSLGYDFQRMAVERSLLAAAKDVGLEEPFVHIMRLGDFSVEYRVAGLLTDVKGIISSRSKLRGAVLDYLHRDGIEIVSPNFMNQRILPDSKSFIPEPPASIISEPEKEESPEKLVFDKADQAESIEKLRIRKEDLLNEIEDLKSKISGQQDENIKNQLKIELDTLKTRLERLTDYLSQREKNEN